MKLDYSSNIWKYYVHKVLGSLELTAAFFVLFLMANGLSMSQIMFIEMVFMILTLALEVPSGAFADTYGRKTALLLAGVFCSIAFLIYGLGTSFISFFLAAIVLSFSFAFYSGADTAFLYDTLKEIKKEKDYSIIFGKTEFISILTLGLASLGGALVVRVMGERVLFFITAFFFFMHGLIAISFKEPPTHKNTLENNYLSHLKSASVFVIKHPTVKYLILYYGLFAALGHLAWFVIQPYFGPSPVLLGIGMIAYFLPFGFGLLMGDRIIKKSNPKRLLYLLIFLSSLSFILSYFSIILGIIFIGLMSLFCGIRDVFISKEINIHTSSHHRATVLSIQSISKSMMYIIAAPLIGIMVDITGAKITLLSIGIVLFIFSGIIFLIFRKIKL